MTDNTKALKVEYRDTGSLIPYVNNSRTHSEEQVTQVASSIKEFGFTNPILIDEKDGIIAGHGRLMAAKKLGLDTVPTITLAGLSEAQRKAYIIADNQLALNSGWDLDMLRVEIDQLKELDFDITLTGFELGDLDDLIPGKDEEEEDSENPYTQKISVPTYEPADEVPEFKDMYSNDKAQELLDKIHSSSVDKEVKDFLKMAAYRHTVFNYEKIADFYSNADKETQELMEESALVIIDVDKAIENGFVKLTEELKKILNEEHEE